MGAEDQFLVVLVAAVDVLGRCTITGHTWRDPFPGIPSLLGTVNTIGFSASFGVLLASGFKLPKYTLTTLFFFLPHNSNSHQKFCRGVERYCRNLFLEVTNELKKNIIKIKQRTDNCS